MREKSLKITENIFMLPLLAGIISCTPIKKRPPSLVYYPQAQSDYNYQTNYAYYQVPKQQNQTFDTNIAYTQPYQQQYNEKYYSNTQQIQNNQVAPPPQIQKYNKIQTTALISENAKTETNPKPEQEQVIWEEVVYIPSALQTTPVDEIEILSESTKSIEEFKEENKNSKSEDYSPEPISETTKTESQTIQPITTEQTTKPQKVKVYKGDTLYSIAQRNNIKVYDLAEYNKLKAPFILKLGQIIEIPTGPVAKKETIEKKPEIITNLNNTKTFIEEPKKDIVIVKKGDTIYSIAKQNNVPLKDVILRNNLKAPYTLTIGDKIYIPNTAFHIVKPQDTAYSISRKYNVNLNSLVKLNKLSEPYTLTIGQKLLLPATNIDVIEKQVKYVVKDKDSTKTIQPSVNEEIKDVAKIKIAQKQKLEEKPKPIQTEIEIAKQEKIEQIIVKPAPLTSKKFMWPLNGKIISLYGIKNNGKRNDGINISAKMGTPVIATENGIVAYAGNELKGLGNLVIIKHDKDFMTIYAHNDTLLVKKGDKVKRGDKIATVGKTGRVTTPQLHFEIRTKTKSINPIEMLEKK